MNLDDYDRLRFRVRGPLYAAGEYLGFESVIKSLEICDEGEKLVIQARNDIQAAQQSVHKLIAYAERMHGFVP